MPDEEFRQTIFAFNAEPQLQKVMRKKSDV